MKLIYLTSQKYPSAKADPFFVKSMAMAFSKILDRNFLFLIRGDTPNEFKHLNVVSVWLPRRFRTVLYFFYVPVLIIFHKWSDSETVFFSSDPYLLATLIFWRKVLKFKYHICSDWHQLFDDWRDAYVAANSDYLVATSNRLKGLLVSICGIDSNNIEVAYGGVDTVPFFEKAKIKKEELRTTLTLPHDSFLVGYVGGFRSVGMEKGLDTMIKALSYLNEKTVMVFVGGSKEQINEYKTLAKKENVGKRCIFVEKQKPFEKIVEYMMAMDVLVIPYPDKHHFRDYGFPMKVWEYMASGRPIIYSNLEIIGEILEGRGTHFQPDNASSLADAVMSVSSGTATAEIVAAQNSKDIRDYTWEARAKKIVSFIEKAHNERQAILELFSSHVAIYEERMRYRRSDENNIQRVFHNTRKLGFAYVFYSLSRFGLLGFLKNIKASFFFGKMMILPADDVGANVFSMYGILPHKSERRLTKWMIKNLKDNDVFYDIGAHMGYYTALAEKLITRGRVHAFEANEKLCSYLNQNFHDAEKVHVVCTAIANIQGKVDFYDATQVTDSSASSRFTLSGRDIAPIQVRATTIDEYVSEGHASPTVLKLDIEGGKYDAILGATNTLQKNNPRIIMEVRGDENGKTYSDTAVRKLQEMGYNAHMIQKDGSIEKDVLDDPVETVSCRGTDARDNIVFLRQ